MRVARWLAGCVRPEDRRDDRPWRTHRAVATMQPDQQRYWLAKAAEHHWSEEELRRQRRSKHSIPKGPEKVRTSGEGLCPNCGQPTWGEEQADVAISPTR